ncbi:MAG: late competence development ComFB family protein, partial [Pseudanabaena sp.]
MHIFINVLEEIIVKEVRIQIEELRPEIQLRVKVAEVVAYTLNRLPPLFATSMIGWKYQYDYALNELHPQISQIVMHGIKAILFGDPLHDSTPLPKHLFLNSAGVLYQLNQLLKRKYLRWRDIPIIVREISDKYLHFNQISNSQDQTLIQEIEETRLQNINHLNHQHRAVISSSKRFMQKQLIQKQQESFHLELEKAWAFHINSYEGSWSQEKRAKDALEMEYRALESYTLEAQLGLIN